MFLPPASRTTMSGRSVPSGVATATCSSKSQRALIPASSTTRRSCSSPQRPLASGRRSAVTSAWVWARSCSELCRAMATCSASAACEPGPGRVGLPQLRLDPGQGFPQRPDQMLDRRAADLQFAGRVGVRRLQPPSATSRNREVLASSACADRAWKRSASWPSTSAARSAELRSIILARSSAARARSSAARARPEASAAAAASRPRANRYPIAAPMKIPSSSPASNKTAPICSAMISP